MRLTHEDLEKIEQVKILIENDYKHHYTQEHLARRFHINESKLRKGFKQVYKKTIYEYLVWVRVEKAKSLLETTDEPVKALAVRVGCDVSNLEKQFKKLTGMAPLEWRKKHTGQEVTGS